MMKLELKEIVYIHKIISEQDIKGADAPFVTSMLNKITEEYNRLQKASNEPIKK
tara:strand:- start:635 stop:796 length:162 start_codon:yes stop_codon:yes gene_type:complete